MLSTNLFKSGLTLTIGSALGALCSFLRNILVARLIAVEDYGIAATFALTMTLIEMTSNLAVDRLIVQAEEGDDPKLQGTAHVFEIGRGVLSALILFAIANPVALLFNLPNLVWAYQLLAVVPLVRGFIHLDSVRFQREMKFRPAMCIEVLPQLISFGAAWFIAQEFGDYRLMLALIIVQVVTTVIFSHLLSDRPYRWSWNGRFFKKIMKFGWPLMLNGVLLFGVFQADRAIVGAAIGMEQLGWFGAAFTLTLFPSMVAAKICQSFLLPLLSRNKADHKRFVDGSNATLEICLVVGAILAVATAVGGPAVLILLFGERYSEGASVIVWLGLMQGLRLVKAGPVIVAMSRGITTLPLLSNIARSLAIVMALYSVWVGWGVLGVALSAVIGEGLAVVLSFVLLHSKFTLGFSFILVRIVCVITGVALVAILSQPYFDGSKPFIELSGAIAAVLVTLGLSILLMPEFIRWIKQQAEHNV